MVDGWRYLVIVMDQYSRRILAWILSRRRTTRETCRVFARALRRRHSPLDFMFHSDHGTEYTSVAFCTFVARRDVQQSLSVRGPEDNAHAESFFHSLKAELTRGTPVGTEQQLRRALDEYIRYYNTRRLHSALGYRSPVAFERECCIEL